MRGVQDRVEPTVEGGAGQLMRAALFSLWLGGNGTAAAAALMIGFVGDVWKDDPAINSRGLASCGGEAGVCKVERGTAGLVQVRRGPRHCC